MMGKFTPLQANVLGLGGVVCGVPEDLISEEDRLNVMAKGLSNLRKETGMDFGFDICKWNEFLLNSPKFHDEYTFDYGWRSVNAAILELVSDEDRIRLVNKITTEKRDHR